MEVLVRSQQLDSHLTGDLQVPATGTNMESVIASNNCPLLRRHVPDAQIATPQLEGRFLGGPRLKLHLLEPAQLPYGLISRCWELHVQLRDLSTSHIARVLQIGADLGYNVPEVLTATDSERTSSVFTGELLGVGRNVEALAKFEGRVRETKAEFVSRCNVLLVKVLVVDKITLLEVDFRLLADSCARVVVGLVLRNGVHQLSGWVHIAKENVVDRMTG